MSRTFQKGVLLVVVLFAFAGCATGRNYQNDMDILNAKIATLEAQLSEKDAAIAKLQNRMREDETALSRAENDKRMLSEKLDAAQSKVKPKTSQAPDSDLK